MGDAEVFNVFDVKWIYADAPVYKGNREPPAKVKSRIQSIDVQCTRCGTRWDARPIIRGSAPGKFLNLPLAILLRCENTSCDGSESITKASLA